MLTRVGGASYWRPLLNCERDEKLKFSNVILTSRKLTKLANSLNYFPSRFSNFVKCVKEARIDFSYPSAVEIVNKVDFNPIFYFLKWKIFWLMNGWNAGLWRSIKCILRNLWGQLLIFFSSWFVCKMRMWKYLRILKKSGKYSLKFY